MTSNKNKPGIVVHDCNGGSNIGIERIYRQIGEGVCGEAHLVDACIDGVSKRAVMKQYFLSPGDADYEWQVEADLQGCAVINKLLSEKRISSDKFIRSFGHGIIKNKNGSSSRVAIMEHAPGISYNHVIDNEMVETNQHLRILLDVANALMDLHNNGFAHYDIKPQNIIVDLGGKDAKVTLIDYGLVADKKRHPIGEKENAIFGSLPYMDPKNLDAGYRSDSYGMAMLIMYAVSGQRPSDLHSLDEDSILAKKKGDAAKIRKMTNARLGSALFTAMSDRGDSMPTIIKAIKKELLIE